MKYTVSKSVCDKCEKVPAAGEVKSGKHVECGGRVASSRFCVKRVYVCPTAGEKNCGMTSNKPGRCNCKKSMKSKDDSPSLIKYVCMGCEASALNRAKIKHDAEKHKTAKSKAVKPRCGH